MAALTIPTLMQNQQEAATVSALKKVYSALSNAYTLAVQENGPPNTWGFTGGHDPKILTMLMPYLNVNKDCTDGSKGCFPTGEFYMYLAPSAGSDGVYNNGPNPKLSLADGTLILTFIDSTSCVGVIGGTPALMNYCGRYYVDVNGWKKPNTLGEDVFAFWLTKYGIVPAGSPQQTAGFNFSNDCKDRNSHYGRGCTAWVLYNENMDYLHCNNLSWATKTQCD